MNLISLCTSVLCCSLKTNRLDDDAKQAIEALGALAPKTATVRRNGKVAEIAVDALRVGDMVLVKPNERLAADGFVTKGESSINQAHCDQAYRKNQLFVSVP